MGRRILIGRKVDTVALDVCCCAEERVGRVGRVDAADGKYEVGKGEGRGGKC